MSTKPLIVIAGTCLLAVLSQLPAPPVAQAEPAKEVSRAEAKRLLRAGSAAYQRHDYRAALTDFQAAMAAFPSPRIQYNLGQTYRGLKQPVEATMAFEAFLADSDRITSLQRSEAQKAIKQLESEVARVNVQTNVPEVEVEIDGAVRGKTPLSKPLVLAPGRHEISLVRAGYAPLHDTLSVVGGEERKASFVLESNRPSPSPTPSSSSASPSAAPAPAPPVAADPGAGAAPAPNRFAPAAAPAPLPAAAAAPAAAPSSFVTVPGVATQAESPSHARNVLGGSLLATSAVLAAGGAAFLGASWSSYNQAKDSGCNRNCPTAADDVDSRALWSKVLFGAAAVAGASAATVFIVYPDTPTSRASASPPAGLVLVGHGRF